MIKDKDLGECGLSLRDYIDLLIEAGLDWQYVMWANRARHQSVPGGPMAPKDFYEFILNPSLAQHTGYQLDDHGKFTVPEVLIPLGIHYTASNGKTYAKKLKRSGYCESCLGDRHTGGKCEYKDYCRLCLQKYSDMGPDRGNKHNCLLGVLELPKVEKTRYSDANPAPTKAGTPLKDPKKSQAFQSKLKRRLAAMQEQAAAAKRMKQVIITILIVLTSAAGGRSGHGGGRCHEDAGGPVVSYYLKFRFKELRARDLRYDFRIKMVVKKEYGKKLVNDKYPSDYG